GTGYDIFRGNVVRCRALVGTEIDEHASVSLAKGRIPVLKALRLHNGTIYRWNRPCYGISENGKPHLRVELRVLPSGPTIADEVANGRFWLALMMELSATSDDLPARIQFADPRVNLYAAGREGLGAHFIWLDGKQMLAQQLILDHLLPLAKAGLGRAGADPEDSARYLGIVERRVRTGRNGARWMLRRFRGWKAAARRGRRPTP